MKKFIRQTIEQVISENDIKIENIEEIGLHFTMKHRNENLIRIETYDGGVYDSKRFTIEKSKLTAALNGIDSFFTNQINTKDVNDRTN